LILKQAGIRGPRQGEELATVVKAVDFARLRHQTSGGRLDAAPLAKSASICPAPVREIAAYASPSSLVMKAFAATLRDIVAGSIRGELSYTIL
jgi:hypothetical protein